MKTKSLFLSLFAGVFLCFSNVSYAQYHNGGGGGSSSSGSGDFKKLHIGVDVGYSAPSGDFSSTDPSKEPVVQPHSTDTTHIAGYAKGGFHFNVYATYMFSEEVGAMISVGGSMNSYDITTLNSNFAAEFTTGGYTGALPAFTSSGGYFIGQYLIGPYISIPVGGGKLKVEIKGLVGLTAANYPTLSYNYSALGITESESVTVKSYSGFGYNVGAGLEYMMSDMLGLHFNICYGGTSVSYPGYTVTATEGTLSVNQTHSTDLAMSLGLIQVTVGASIEL
jgi:Outer membrane protein beta-barrel domain